MPVSHVSNVVYGPTYWDKNHEFVVQLNRNPISDAIRQVKIDIVMTCRAEEQ